MLKDYELCFCDIEHAQRYHHNYKFVAENVGGNASVCFTTNIECKCMLVDIVGGGGVTKEVITCNREPVYCIAH